MTFRINTVGNLRAMISIILFMFTCVVGISKFHEVSGMRILFILSGLALLGIILFHFTIGVMLISIKGDQIHFAWEKKPLFDFRNMESIGFRDIRKVVVDQGQIIKKIQTPNSGVRIESFSRNSFFQDDTQELLSYLKEIQFARRAVFFFVDIWDIWHEKGWLKYAYMINRILIVGGFSITIFSIAKVGFGSYNLLFMVASLTQLIRFQIIIKNKLK